MKLLHEVAVLVVDDVNGMRAQTRDMLKQFGFQKITTAPSGEEAKAILAQQDVELIISDWHMIPGDGLNLLDYVRSHPDYSNIPFIMVTAEKTKEAVVEAVKFGVDDYITKPFDSDQIQSKVLSVLIKKKVLSK